MLPVLFSIGSFHLYSFSIFLIVAWIFWSFVFWRYLRSYAVTEERIFDIMFYVTITALVFARLAFVATHISLFSHGWLKVITLWVQPGLSLYGGVVAGVLVSVVLAWQYKVRVAYVLDAIALSYLWALLPGLTGALLDGSVVGTESGFPWAIRYVGYAGKRHPVELYAVIVVLALLLVLRIVSVKKMKLNLPEGILAMWCFSLYAPLFFGLEFFTERSVYWGNVSANQWVLIGILGQSMGAFYVRGGGKERLVSIGQKIRMTYDKFSERYFRRYPRPS